MDFLDQLTSFNTLLVMLGTSLLGVSCGVVGCFTVLRQRALVGDAIAHAALPGVCVSFLLFYDRHFGYLFAGAVVFGLLSVIMISSICSYSRIKEDAAIGIVLSSLFGLGIALSRIIHNTPDGNYAGLDNFIFGKAATITSADVWFIMVVSILAIFFVTIFFKELQLLCFDREFAWTQGYPVMALDIFLMGLVAMCTAAGLPAVGAVLVASLLIIPAASARLWTDNLRTMLFLAGAFGALSCLSGTVLSVAIPGPLASQGLPTGPLIIISSAVIFSLSLALSPSHGLYAYLVRRGRRHAS